MNEKLKFELDMLVKEYDIRYQEWKFYSDQYHSQINLIYLFISAIVTFTTFLFSGILSYQNILSNQYSSLLAAISLVLMSVIQFYLISMMMNALYRIFVNSVRMGIIEQEINEKAKIDVLVWESKSVKELYDIKSWHYKSWIRPENLVAVWQIMLLIFTNGFICLLWYLLVKDFFVVFSIVLFLLLIFHIYQWFALQINSFEYSEKRIRQSMETSKNKKSESPLQKKRS
jgi:hypothetical protein